MGCTSSIQSEHNPNRSSTPSKPIPRSCKINADTVTIAVIGAQGVGKSTLIHKFLTFSENELEEQKNSEEPKTATRRGPQPVTLPNGYRLDESGKFMEYTLRDQKKDVVVYDKSAKRDRCVRLHIKDMPKEDHMNYVNNKRTMIKNAQYIFYCVEPSKDPKVLQDFVSVCRAKEDEDCCVLLVGMKHDSWTAEQKMNNRRLAQNAMVQKRCEREYFEISALSNYGMSQLYEEVVVNYVNGYQPTGLLKVGKGLPQIGKIDSQHERIDKIALPMTPMGVTNAPMSGKHSNFVSR